MMAIIKDYFLMVFIRMIIGYMFFLFFLCVIFVGYIFIADWVSAVNFITGLTDNDFAKIVVWLPFVLSWFNSSETNDNRTSYKFDSHNNHYNFTSSNSSIEETYYNPSTGLPMMGGIGGVDVSGKAYGQL